MRFDARHGPGHKTRPPRYVTVMRSSITRTFAVTTPFIELWMAQWNGCDPALAILTLALLPEARPSFSIHTANVF